MRPRPPEPLPREPKGGGSNSVNVFKGSDPNPLSHKQSWCKHLQTWAKHLEAFVRLVRLLLLSAAEGQVNPRGGGEWESSEGAL